MGFIHRESNRELLTYIMAAIGSFFLFVAGTIRNHTVAEKLIPNYGYATFYINAKIFPLVLTGVFFFFVHSFMYYFTFYDDASAVSINNNELKAILSIDEESNPNASNNNDQYKDEVVNHENEA